MHLFCFHCLTKLLASAQVSWQVTSHLALICGMSHLCCAPFHRLLLLVRPTISGRYLESKLLVRPVSRGTCSSYVGPTHHYCPQAHKCRGNLTHGILAQRFLNICRRLCVGCLKVQPVSKIWIMK